MWVNRLIGDEQYPRDYKVRDGGEPYLDGWPAWFVEGTPRTEPRRKAFTSYHIFKKESPLLPSGLLGPVYLRTVKGESEAGQAYLLRELPDLHKTASEMHATAWNS